MSEDELAYQIYLYYIDKGKACTVAELAEFCGKSESSIRKVLRELNGFAPKGADKLDGQAYKPRAQTFGKAAMFVPTRWYLRDIILKQTASVRA